MGFSVVVVSDVEDFNVDGGTEVALEAEIHCGRLSRCACLCC